MTVVSEDTPLTWSDTLTHADHIRTHGIERLIHLYHQAKQASADRFLWGDELEMMVVELNDQNQTAKLSLRQKEILDAMANDDLIDANVSFQPEYGRYMLECTPAAPFTGDFANLLQVEPNMAKRRGIARQHMGENEVPMTLSSYPRLGVGEFYTPYEKPVPNGDKISGSVILPDHTLVSPDARYLAIFTNICERRGSKMIVNVPVYVDANTPQPFVDPDIPEEGRDNISELAAVQNHVYMDGTAFGAGCCCLQVTMQASDINEARTMYDRLVPMTPIFLALAAATPIHKGYLTNQDTRWNVITSVFDDRTDIERGVKPEDPDYQGHNSSQRVPKARCGTVSCYISQTGEMSKNRQFYNDQELVVNNNTRQRLLEAGVDEPLADHFAHLFCRDPIFIFPETLDYQDGGKATAAYFENIQGTNWQSVRIKPPPPGAEGSIGWRVEFRPMDVQLSDFENAAFSIFIVLLTRTALAYNLNFFLPISKVDENMTEAHRRDGVNQAKFWFRTNVFDHGGECQCKQLYIDEIINGSENFIGLVPLVYKYLELMDTDQDTLSKLDRYLKLVSLRASGDLFTAASWIRHFVRSHPDYNRDSVVSEKINYDLMKACQRLTKGQGLDDEFKGLLGDPI